MTRLIKKILASHDLKLTHNRSDTWTPGIDILGLIRHQLFERIKSLNILQIGANDGQQGDWLRDFVNDDASMSVLVEPLPQPFSTLRSLYHENPRVKCVNAALATSNTYATIYHAHFPCDSPAHFSQYASFHKRVINKHRSAIQAAGGTIREAKVPAITGSELLEYFPDGGPELIGIDTEGFDAIAVNLLLDAGAKPTMLVYEHCHTRGEDDARCRKRLNESGYLLARINRDTVAVQAEAWGRL